jgi:hypothetical protein
MPDSAKRLLRHQWHGLLEFAEADQAPDRGNQQEGSTDQQGGQPGGHDGGQPHDGGNDETHHKERDENKGNAHKRRGNSELHALALDLHLGEGDLVIELAGRQPDEEF